MPSTPLNVNVPLVSKANGPLFWTSANEPPNLNYDASIRLTLSVQVEVVSA